jgi:hypothetical protein
VLTEVGSAAAGFTVAFIPAGVSSPHRLSVVVAAATFSLAAWLVIGGRVAVPLGIATAVGLVFRFALAAVITSRASRP